MVTLAKASWGRRCSATFGRCGAVGRRRHLVVVRTSREVREAAAVLSVDLWPPLVTATSCRQLPNHQPQQTRRCPAGWLPSRLQIHHGRSVTMGRQGFCGPALTKSEIGDLAWTLSFKAHSDALTRQSSLARRSHTHFSGTHHCFLFSLASHPRSWYLLSVRRRVACG
jgi:hypothetical protein